MQVRVLGCSGGIGGERHTTSFLVDDDILIDAGSGVTRLSLEAMARVRHVFITHAHLDHILALPLLLDSVGAVRTSPLLVHALPEVIEILKAHLFNWQIWPDFARIPDVHRPAMRYAALDIGVPERLDGREIIAIPASHGRPAVGFLLRGATGSLIFSGDTASHTDLFQLANATDDLRHFIVEASFANSHEHIAEISDHYCPATLLPDLAKLRSTAQVWITHLKPGGEAEIMAELAPSGGTTLGVRPLQPDQVFDL